MADKNLKITLSRSLIGASERQIKTVEALGIKKRTHSVVKEDTPEIRGMIAKVDHLVEVEELES